MLRHLCQFVAATSIVLALSGCFSSDYDISLQIKPEFPLPVGQYKIQGKQGPLRTLTRYGDAYMAIGLQLEGDKQPDEYFRFFRVPEFDNYIVQHWREPEQGTKKVYAYLYARIEPVKMTFLGLKPGELPQYLQRLVEEKKTFGISILDGPRDTLYVLREVGRRDIKLHGIDTYTHQ